MANGKIWALREVVFQSHYTLAGSPGTLLCLSDISLMTWFGNPVTIILELLLPYNVAIRKDNSKAHISAWRNGYEPMFQ